MTFGEVGVFFKESTAKYVQTGFPRCCKIPHFGQRWVLEGLCFSRAVSPEMVPKYKQCQPGNKASFPFHPSLKTRPARKIHFQQKVVFLISYHKAAISFSDSIFKRAVPDVSLWCRVPVLAYSVGTDWLEGKGDPWHCYIVNEHSVWTKLCFFSGLMSFLLQVARLMEMGFSRGDALEALRASNNDLNVATNFLLQHWWVSVRRNSPRGVCTRLKEDQSHLLDRLTKVVPASSVRKKRLALRDRWLKAMFMNDVKCSQAFKSIGGFCPGYPCQNNFSFSLLLDIT